MAFSTDRSLLSKIQKGDEVGWFDFHRTYAPLIYLRGGDHNLTESEREELTQEVLLSVFKNSGTFHYDKSKGRFRGYLRTIIDRRAVDILRKRGRRVSLVCEGAEEEVDVRVEAELEELWEREWQSHILNQVLEDLKSILEPVTYQAFELYAISDWRPKRVADFLDISVNSVYVAKNRAVEKLRELVARLENES